MLLLRFSWQSGKKCPEPFCVLNIMFFCPILTEGHLYWTHKEKYFRGAHFYVIKQMMSISITELEVTFLHEYWLLYPPGPRGLTSESILSRYANKDFKKVFSIAVIKGFSFLEEGRRRNQLGLTSLVIYILMIPHNQ